MLGVGELVAHHVHHGVEQADGDAVASPRRPVLPPTLRPVSREYSSTMIDSAVCRPVVMSATGGPGLRGCTSLAGDRTRARFGLNQQVVSARVRQRPTRPIAVDLHRHHVRVAGLHIGRGDAQPARRPRCQVRHQHVRPIEQAMQNVGSLSGFQIDGDRLFCCGCTRRSAPQGRSPRRRNGGRNRRRSGARP